MKTFDFLYLLLFFILILFNSTSTQEVQTDAVISKQEITDSKVFSCFQNTDLKLHTFKDQEKEIMGYLPLPASWSISSNGLSGPEGVLIRDHAPINFFETKWEAASVETWILDRIKTAILEQGDSIIAFGHLPEITAKNNSLMLELNGGKAIPSKLTNWGLDYQDPNGRKSFLLIHLNHISNQSYHQFEIRYSELKSPADCYESVKAIYLHGIKNIKLDAKYLAVLPLRLSRQADEVRLRSLENSLYRTSQYFPPAERKALEEERWKLSQKLKSQTTAEPAW